MRRAWPCVGHAHPGVDREAAVGKRQHRIEVELGDLGQVLGEEREAKEEVDERGLVGRRRASEAGDEPAGLAGADELFGVDGR